MSTYNMGAELDALKALEVELNRLQELGDAIDKVQRGGLSVLYGEIVKTFDEIIKLKTFLKMDIRETIALRTQFEIRQKDIVQLN